jgi:hypothetical protein
MGGGRVTGAPASAPVAQARDMYLQALTRPREGLFAPQFIDQALAGHHTTGHQRQHREQRRRSLPPSLRPAIHPGLDRTEQLDQKPLELSVISDRHRVFYLTCAPTLRPMHGRLLAHGWRPVTGPHDGVHHALTQLQSLARRRLRRRPAANRHPHHGNRGASPQSSTPPRPGPVRPDRDRRPLRPRADRRAGATHRRRGDPGDRKLRRGNRAGPGAGPASARGHLVARRHNGSPSGHVDEPRRRPPARRPGPAGTTRPAIPRRP